MIRLALIACLLLSACATTQKGPPRVDLYADPLIVVDGRAYLIGKVRRQDERALIAEHLPGVIDDEEREALRMFGWSAAADGATTIIGLTCAGVREVNPLLGASPHPAAVIAFSYGTYRLMRWEAARSHRFDSSAPFIRAMSWLKLGASAWNARVISQACMQ